jgi:hypothetical protein
MSHRTWPLAASSATRSVSPTFPLRSRLSSAGGRPEQRLDGAEVGVFEGTPADLAANEAVRKERLEVSPARRAPCTPGSTHSRAPDARGRRPRPGVR